MNNRGIVKTDEAKKRLLGESEIEKGNNVTWNWHKAEVARHAYLSSTSGGICVKNHALKPFTATLCASTLPVYVFIGDS
jgi:hypothetical protein